MHDTSARNALAFAIAHELGNHLAGIRLEAHLLDEDLGPAGLARASLAIDALAGQSGPLLALLRPLLAPASRPAAIGEWADLLEGVRRQLIEEGTGGRAVEVQSALDPGEPGPAIEGLHALLLALVGPLATLPSTPGPVTLRVARRKNVIELVCELPGDALREALVDAGPHGLRGRALAVALARVLVADAGGTIDVGVEGDRSRVVLRLPG